MEQGEYVLNTLAKDLQRQNKILREYLREALIAMDYKNRGKRTQWMCQASEYLDALTRAE